MNQLLLAGSIGVLAALGATHATFPPSLAAAIDAFGAERRGLAQGYRKARGVLRPAPMAVTLGFAPGSWAIVSANDVANYLRMLLAVGVAANLSSGRTGEIAAGVLTLIQGGTPGPSTLPVERGPSTYEPDPRAWARYVGDYDSDRGALRIYVESDRLLGRVGDLAFELEAYGENDFVLRGEVGGLEGYPITFAEEPDGRILVLLAGQPFGAKR